MSAKGRLVRRWLTPLALDLVERFAERRLRRLSETPSRSTGQSARRCFRQIGPALRALYYGGTVVLNAEITDGTIVISRDYSVVMDYIFVGTGMRVTNVDIPPLRFPDVPNDKDVDR